MFWFGVLVLMLIVIGASVAVGLRLKDTRRHNLTRKEMMALKTSGALPHRKSGM